MTESYHRRCTESSHILIMCITSFPLCFFSCTVNAQLQREASQSVSGNIKRNTLCTHVTTCARERRCLGGGGDGTEGEKCVAGEKEKFSAGLLWSQGPPVQIQYGVLIAIFSCIAFSNFFKFVHWLQFWCGNEASAFHGGFRALFVHFFFAILWPFSFWKVRSIRHLFLLRFFFHFPSHDDPSMGLTAVVKIPSSSADFTLHHCDAALKNAWKWKNRWMPNEFQLLQ